MTVLTFSVFLVLLVSCVSVFQRTFSSYAKMGFRTLSWAPQRGSFPVLRVQRYADFFIPASVSQTFLEKSSSALTCIKDLARVHYYIDNRHLDNKKKSYIFAALMMTTLDFLSMADEAMRVTEQATWASDTFLNKRVMENTIMGEGRGRAVEWHPLIPFLPKNTKVLFLGSFPPQRKRWCMDFFYPNFINDHWRIEGLVFYDDAHYFVDSTQKTFKLKEIVEHLKNRGIGFFDTAIAVRRLADNASDKHLEVVVPTDIPNMAAHLPALKAIVTTGEKATETIAEAMGLRDEHSKLLVPKVGTAQSSPIRGIEIYRLPSSSRAYPMALAKKAEAYKMMFERYL